MRKLLSALVAVLVTLGLAGPAWGGGPPVHDKQVFQVEVSFRSGNPCTGDEGTVTLHELWVIRSLTFPDGSAHVKFHTSGTFDFDATDPAAPDYFAAAERPGNMQIKLDANGNGTQTSVDGYDARGTDGSRVVFHEVVHFTVVGFVMLTPTLDNFYLHCSQ